jgi:hypothetical protein
MITNPWSGFKAGIFWMLRVVKHRLLFYPTLVGGGGDLMMLLKMESLYNVKLFVKVITNIGQIRVEQ